MLGRQKFDIERPIRHLCEETLEKNGYSGVSRFSLLQDDKYAEKLMKFLGFGDIETMDFSDYEGATVLHDLNHLPPAELEEQFDFIFDGGTIEHVFNVPNALESIYRMLKPGGRFLSMNGFNGWMGHGMYQFNPELVWTFWRRACNCKVIDCRAVPKELPQDTGHTIMPDPAETGVRLKLAKGVGAGRVYLSYEIEKTPESHLPDFALQSDYETKWQGAVTARPTHLETTKGTRE